jgi:hypothetical protein
MQNLPEDLYTEPESSPDTLANLGPLRRLAGVWESDQGVDINPKADGPQRRVYREHVRMEPIDAQANGPQLLYGLRYHIHINTPEEAITFHDQVGYWLWEPATGTHHADDRDSSRPGRAGGRQAQPDDDAHRSKPGAAIRASASARRRSSTKRFRTDYYRIDITFNRDGSWTYVTRTDLAIRGQLPAFDHRDTNTLRRIAAPTPNPLALIDR